MILIAGLGNPGQPYVHTRHNAGFDVIDRIADLCGIHSARKKMQAMVAEGQYGGQRIALAKPQTYMNESGIAIQQLMRWYHLEPQDVLIISDDIDLSPGTLRLRPHGGAGTHNGWKSIIQQTGSDRFPRVRVGVGAPPPQWDLADWVLSRYMGSADQEAIETSLDEAAKAALFFVKEGMAAAMNKYNRKKQDEPAV